MKYNNRILLFLFIIFIILGTLGAGFFLYQQPSTKELPSMLRKINIDFTQNQTKNAFPQSYINHVFVIVEENHDWSEIYKNSSAPYINKTLLQQGAYASNYHSVPENMDEIRPSEPNYIFMEAGVVAFPDHTFTTNDSPSIENSTASKDHLVSVLEKQGYTWKSYQEGINGDNCPIHHTDEGYAPKHNPMIFFQDVSGNPPSTKNKYCQEHIRPLDELENDLKTGNIPNYVFITPDLSHDMHDGSISQADTWLSQIVPMITNSETFKKDGVLFITWDESEKNSEDNKPIGMIILSPYVKTNYTNNIYYSHASFLKTVQEIFHITPLLGFANDPQTQSLSDFFISQN